MGILAKTAQADVVKKFYVVGVNFQKTDTQHRSKFSITSAKNEEAYAQSSACLEHFLILSTCNRTEIYGFAPCEYVLLAFLKSLSGATHTEISGNAYIKEGDEAVKHLLTVASGLDSQIPGDYEIIGQIRKAFQLAKNSGKSNGFIERVVNQANQISKAIKNSTAFSDGTVSVSYAVAQQVKKIMERDQVRKVCVVGLGDMGHNTLRYLLQHIPEAEITIVNRDEVKLAALASQYNLKSFPFAQMPQAIRESEIVIMATSVSQPVLQLHHIKETDVHVIFDLSMPRNVSNEVYQQGDVTVWDVDQISASVSDTLDKRLAEIPKVKAIVQAKAQEFFEWQERRKSRTTIPLKYEQFLPHAITSIENSHTRQHTCFMADQCCEGKPGKAWLPVQAYSA
jgi:glutamyl-tRNA reductase